MPPCAGRSMRWSSVSIRIERDRRTTMRADVAEGLRFLWRHRLLRTLAVMVGVLNLASNATWAILVLYAVGPGSAMRLSEPAFGLLLTTVAVGSLVGSLIADRVERRLGRARSLVVAVVGSALFVGAPAMTADPYLIGAAFFVGASRPPSGTSSRCHCGNGSRRIGCSDGSIAATGSSHGAPSRSVPPRAACWPRFSGSVPCSPSWRC